MVTRVTANVTAFHVALTRRQLLYELARRGPEAVLTGFTGTLAEARALIATDPREVFVLDRTCDRQDAKGHCLGHRHVRCPACGAWLAAIAGADAPVCPSCGVRD